MNLRYLALAAALGCGAKPNLVGDGGGDNNPSPASLAITPDQADATLGAPAVFTITNDGAATTGAIGLEIIGTDSTSFSIGNSTCSVLVAQASCTVNVRLTPRATGTLMAKLRAFTGGTETTATLSATSNNSLVIIPPNPTFVKTATNNDSPAAIYTVRNLGAATTGPLIMGLDTVTPQFTFVHQMDLCTNTMLANGDDCTVALAFSPRGTSTILARTGALSARDGNGASAMIDLAATVGRLAFTMSPTTATFNGSACGAPPPGTSLDFMNETWAPLTTFTAMLTGPNANAFTVSTTCPTPPASGATCTVTVSLVPTTSALSTLTATLTVKGTQDMATSTQTFSIGASVTACDLVVTPPSISFPNTVVGQTGTGTTVTVANNGAVGHAITATLGGANPTDFTIQANQCGTVAPGTNCTLQVAPKPLTVGGKSANLAITTPGLAPPPVTLTEDAAAGLVVTPPSQVFATSGGVPVAQTFTVVNQGALMTGMITTTLSGTGASAFTFGVSSCTTLAPGASCMFQVTYLGNAPATATLSTHATPGGNANDVILTGSSM